MLASKLTGRKYRLVAALAQGGMGEVFVGQEVGAKARGDAPCVAIKTLRTEGARDDVALSRFLDEARLSARLDHPNIARMLDFGEAAGRPFAIFELLQGADLADCLDQLIERRGWTPPEVALCLAIDACRGLHHAHTLEKDGAPLQVVHRDLSPSNLFLTADGQGKVLDFGAAWGRDRITRTKTGMVIGKLEYMPPEQVKGERVDARSDVFAMGLCLQESLSSRRPYASKNEHELVEKIYYARVPDLAGLRPQLPPALYAAVKRATAVDPEARFQSAEELAEELQRIREGITRAPSREILSRFYRNCFGAGRDDRRAERLAELRARPFTADDAFSWAAPPLVEELASVELNSDNLEVVGTPQPARGEEPDTDREPDPVGARGPAPETSVPAAPQRPRTQPSPFLGYAVIGGVVLLALLVGLAIGHFGATLGR